MEAPIEGQELAAAICRFADEKQAEEIVVLDLRGISTITDYFVICTGTSQPHLKAVRSHIAERLKEEHSIGANASEGQAESQWVVLDFSDVIAHVFHSDKRALYALEELWSDAPRIDWQEVPVGSGR